MALRRQVFVRFILAALIMPVILFSLAGEAFITGRDGSIMWLW
jgi:hypothetical protein